MKISKIHQEFSAQLQFLYNVPKQDVLTHPENFLGPNWEVVINFWLYIDTLTQGQLLVVKQRFRSLSRNEQIIAQDKAWNSVVDIAEHCGIAGLSAFNVVFWVNNAASNVAKYATLELIGLDKLLAEGHQPVFFPMFPNL
jgi:hypothetical protein